MINTYLNFSNNLCHPAGVDGKVNGHYTNISPLRGSLENITISFYRHISPTSLTRHELPLANKTLQKKECKK